MDKKCISILILFTALTFFINGISASNIVSSTYSVDSYSSGLSSSSLAFNAIYNASAGFSSITTNFASGIAGGIIFTPNPPATNTSVVVSNLPLTQWNAVSQSQQYLWALTLNPQTTYVLNFTNPAFSFNSSLSLSEMDINTNTSQNTNLLITQFYNPPPEIPSMPGQIYQYLEIELSNSLNSGNVSLIFKLNKTWISQNNISASNISICKLDNLTNNAWIILNTTYYGADDNFDYYQTNVNSFSYFAILGNANNVASSQQQTIISNKIQQNPPSTSKNLIWLFILLAFIIITIIYLIISKKRRIRRIMNGEIDRRKSTIRKLKRMRNHDKKSISNVFSSLRRKERKLFRKS